MDGIRNRATPIGKIVRFLGIAVYAAPEKYGITVVKKIFVITISFAFALTGCSKPPSLEIYTRTASIMQTFIQVKVTPNAGRSHRELKRIVDESFALARSLERDFSIYNPRSEVNALNLAKKREVSNELFNLLCEANRISEITGGKFDITVSPIMKAKGFYRDMPKEIFDRIPAGCGGIGWKNVVLSDDGKTVFLKNGAWVDLSGIAKGYIVDRIAAFLKEKGIESFLINAGGDIYGTRKINGDAWNVGLRAPGTFRILREISLKDAAVATSGDYENVVIDKDTGEKMSHIADPLSGTVLKERSSSVTVMAPTCARADALATAFMAMGKERALTLAEELDNVTVIVADEGGVAGAASSPVFSENITGGTSLGANR